MIRPHLSPCPDNTPSSQMFGRRTKGSEGSLFILSQVVIVGKLLGILASKATCRRPMRCGSLDSDCASLIIRGPPTFSVHNYPPLRTVSSRWLEPQNGDDIFVLGAGASFSLPRYPFSPKCGRAWRSSPLRSFLLLRLRLNTLQPLKLSMLMMRTLRWRSSRMSIRKTVVGLLWTRQISPTPVGHSGVGVRA